MDSTPNLRAALAAMISDYRNGEIATSDASHVDRWISQVPAAVRDPILRELLHVFRWTYFSRAKVQTFIDSIVVNCGRPIRMVTLDATHQALVSLDDCRTLRALGAPGAEAAARFVEKRIEGYDATQPMHRSNAAPVHDALAVCAVIDPTIITTQFIPVDVETDAELSVGRTVCDFRFRSGRPANVHFAMGADEPKFVRMLTEILGRTA